MTCLDQVSNEAREHLVTALYNKQYFLWIGSGFSMNFGFPSWGKVIEKVRTNLGYQGPFSGNYLKNAEILQCHAAKNGSEEASFNEEVIKALMELHSPGVEPEWKSKFVSFAPQMLVTTNWDTVLEELFDNLPNTVVRKDPELRISKKNRNIFKIHGGTGNPESVVVTQSQYHRFQREDTYLNRKIYTLFAEETAIFIGYSLSDPNIFYVYDEVVSGSVKAVSPSFMVVPATTSDEDLAENKLFFEKKNVHIIRADIGEFIDACNNAVDSLAGTVEKFRNDHQPIVTWLEKIIQDISNYDTDEARTRFRARDSANLAIAAIQDMLTNPPIYGQLGGSLLSPSGVLPAREAHKLHQIVIKLSKEYGYPSAHARQSFYETVLSYCENTPIRWDFNQGVWPFIDLLSISSGVSNDLLTRKIKLIKATLDWSAPRYNRGYCWETWDKFKQYISWLNEATIDALVAEAEEEAKIFSNGKASPNAQRWLRELLAAPAASQAIKNRISQII